MSSKYSWIPKIFYFLPDLLPNLVVSSCGCSADHLSPNFYKKKPSIYVSERGTHFHSSPNAYFQQALQMSFGQMRILPFISKWAWDQLMWQQLPSILHPVLQGIYRKKNLYFQEDFCKKQPKKTPIHPNPVTESQKRGGTKRLTIVTHITANSDPLQNLGPLGSIATFGGFLQGTFSHPYYLPTYNCNIPSRWKNLGALVQQVFPRDFPQTKQQTSLTPLPSPTKDKNITPPPPQPRHY